MKSIITILNIYLLAFASTQTAQAQTKEKTIVWIKEKLGQYVKGIDKESIRVSPCEISWVETETEENVYLYYGAPPAKYCSFDPSKAGKWSVEENGQISAESAVVKYADYNMLSGEIEEEEFTELNFFSIELSKEDLAADMAKALNHLATFCEE